MSRDFSYFQPDFSNYNQVGWKVIWYFNKYKYNFKTKIIASVSMWDMSLTLQEAREVSPSSKTSTSTMALGAA